MSAIVLPGVVPPDVLGQLRARVAAGPLVSGKRTAVGRAAAIKNNLVLTPDSASAAGAVELLAGALSANVAFQVATWPEAMLPPMFCRYEVGMGYGDHVDAAIMGDGPSQMRCDVSMTVCLNDASEYDGGELVMDTAGVAHGWKGNAGDVVVYPSDTLHRVAPVTRGVRDVAISWIQSMVRQPERRRILFDLRSAARFLRRLPVAAARDRAHPSQLLQSRSHVGVSPNRPSRPGAGGRGARGPVRR